MNKLFYECDNCGKEYQERISRCVCCCSIFNEVLTDSKNENFNNKSLISTADIVEKASGTNKDI